MERLRRGTSHQRTSKESKAECSDTLTALIQGTQNGKMRLLSRLAILSVKLGTIKLQFDTGCGATIRYLSLHRPITEYDVIEIQ